MEEWKEMSQLCRERKNRVKSEWTPGGSIASQKKHGQPLKVFFFFLTYSCYKRYLRYHSDQYISHIRENRYLKCLLLVLWSMGWKKVNFACMFFKSCLIWWFRRLVEGFFLVFILSKSYFSLARFFLEAIKELAGCVGTVKGSGY